MNPKIIKLALKSGFSSRWMTLLSISTIVFGAASISATMTINYNVSFYIEMLVRKLGGPVLRLSVTEGDQRSFTRNDLNYINSLHEVISARVDKSNSGFTLDYQGRKRQLELKIFDDLTKKLDPPKIISGRSISSIDDFSQTAILSKTAAEALNIPFIPDGGLIVSGRAADLKTPLRIVGIYQAEDSFSSDFGEIFVQPGAYEQIVGDKSLDSLLVRSGSFAGIDLIEQHLKMYFADRWQNELRMDNSKTFVESAKNNFNSMLLAGYVLGAFALFSGCIGMVNIMLLKIRLRRREIGLYRALGFTSTQIRFQFLLEFLLLAGIGSVVGSIIGSLIGMILSELVIPPFNQFSGLSLFVGIFITFILSLVFGMIPANQAVKLDPVEALRT